MTVPAYITVTAPPGRVTPMHPSDCAGLGPGQPTVSAGEIVRVRCAGSQTVRRAVGRGDLIPCDMNGARVESYELAACPEELPGGRVLVQPKAAVRKATP